MTAPKGAGGGHTDGPWHVDEGGDGEILIWDGTDGPYIAEVYESPNEQANARLIAAAPELLEACQTFAEWLRREDEGLPAGIERGTPEGEREWRAWFNENLRICALAQEQARAALAKAGGSL